MFDISFSSSSEMPFTEGQKKKKRKEMFKH